MGTRRSHLLSALLIFCILCSCLLYPTETLAQGGHRLYVFVKDLTLSTPESEASKDNKFIQDAVENLDPSDEVYLLAITNASFSSPVVLLHEQLPEDPSPLKPKLRAQRAHIANKLRTVLEGAVPFAKTTEVVGVTCYASLLFKEHKGPKYLILLGDARNSTQTLNLEEGPIDSREALDNLERAGLIPDLHNIKVFMLGVHTNSITPSHYRNIEEFWCAFFELAGASVVAFRSDRPRNILSKTDPQPNPTKATQLQTKSRKTR